MKNKIYDCLQVTTNLSIYEKGGGGEDGTRTHIPKAPEPKSGASTNFATSPLR